MKIDKTVEFKGQRYRDLVPDTYDLQVSATGIWCRIPMTCRSVPRWR